MDGQAFGVKFEIQSLLNMGDKQLSFRSLSFGLHGQTGFVTSAAHKDSVEATVAQHKRPMEKLGPLPHQIREEYRQLINVGHRRVSSSSPSLADVPEAA